MDCNKQIVYPFIKKAICPIGICLSSLYNNDVTQQLARNIVEDRFEVLFEQFVNAAKKKKLKTRDMVDRKSVTKNLFVEFGLSAWINWWFYLFSCDNCGAEELHTQLLLVLRHARSCFENGWIERHFLSKTKTSHQKHLIWKTSVLCKILLMNLIYQ